MLEYKYVKEQGVRFFPITHRKAIVGLSPNTLVLSESVDIDVDINADGQPITINPMVQQALNTINSSIDTINQDLTSIHNTLNVKASSSKGDGIADKAYVLNTARKITVDGAVTGSMTFDGSGDVTLTTKVNHTHSYAGSSSAGGSATSAVKLQTARNIKITGAATGSASFDGTGDVSINISLATAYLPTAGGTMSGALNTTSRYQQNSINGCLVAVQSTAPSVSTMVWAY